MNKMLATLTAALALATLSANAGTVNVFCQHLGNLASPTTAQQDAYTAFLSHGDIARPFTWPPMDTRP